jgi:hypothetical protein
VQVQLFNQILNHYVLFFEDGNDLITIHMINEVSNELMLFYIFVFTGLVTGTFRVKSSVCEMFSFGFGSINSILFCSPPCPYYIRTLDPDPQSEKLESRGFGDKGFIWEA